MFFLRKSNLEQLPVAMSGVRMGERALQIGIDDLSIAGAIAAKVGLSGHAAIAVTTEQKAARARAAGAAAGVLVDVQIVRLDSLPFDADAFDAVVLHAGDRSLPSLDDSSIMALLREGHRVLRTGGRILIVEGGRRGIGGLFRLRQPAAQPTAPLQALTTGGFRAARPLAAREGYRFTEGLK